VQDLASPPAGAPLLSAVGDLGGFRHDDLDVSPAGAFSTTLILHHHVGPGFAKAHRTSVVRAGSGGLGGAYSADGHDVDAIAAAPMPTTGTVSKGSGSIAVSADGTTLLWAPAGGTPPPARQRHHVDRMRGLAAGVRVAADRVNASQVLRKRPQWDVREHRRRRELREGHHVPPGDRAPCSESRGCLVRRAPACFNSQDRWRRSRKCPPGD